MPRFPSHAIFRAPVQWSVWSGRSSEELLFVKSRMATAVCSHVTKRYGLLHNLRDEEEIVFGGGSIGNHVGGDTTIRDPIRTLAHLERDHRCHRLDTCDV